MADHLQTQSPQEQRRKFWQSHIDAWSISGLTQAKYCRKKNLKTTRFTYWKHKFNKKNLPIEFVEIPTEPVKSFCFSKIHSAPSLRLTMDSRFFIDIPNDFCPATLEQILLTLKRV